MKILLAEDDTTLGFGLKTLLELENFEGDLVSSGSEAIEAYRYALTPYDVVLLDWMLPELSGLEVCRYLRDVKKGRYNGGIIFLTAKTELDDCIKALDAGADDYIKKPFEIKELKARIHALLRRKGKPYVDEVFAFGDFSLDYAQKTLVYHDQSVKFSKTEFQIVQVLFVHHNQIVRRETLFDDVWGNSPNAGRAGLDSYIYNIRKKLKAFSNLELKLIFNIGYELDIHDK